MGAWRIPLPARINGSHPQSDQQPPRHYNNPGGYMANGAGGPPPTVPAPGAVPLLPNQGRVLDTGSIRILCVADVRGKLWSTASILQNVQLLAAKLTLTFHATGHLRSLNDLAKRANANYIIHTGDFGFYDESSLDRIAEK